jgi:GH15 family glucan-1,4-alpha-glucosidase
MPNAIRRSSMPSNLVMKGRWLKVRDEIYEDVLSKGWNEKRQAFVQHYGSESLDAANLMMALTFFMSPGDPRMLTTLDATLLPLAKDGLTANSTDTISRMP